MVGAATFVMVESRRSRTAAARTTASTAQRPAGGLAVDGLTATWMAVME
jgi:hypothetical protein